MKSRKNEGVECGVHFESLNKEEKNNMLGDKPLWVSLWLFSVSLRHRLLLFQTIPVAQTVKNLPAMQETQVQIPGWEDPLEKEMATHSSFIAWRIPWTEESDGLQSTGSQGVGHDWVTNCCLYCLQEVSIRITLRDTVSPVEPKTALFASQ